MGGERTATTRDGQTGDRNDETGISEPGTGSSFCQWTDEVQRLKATSRASWVGSLFGGEEMRMRYPPVLPRKRKTGHWSYRDNRRAQGQAEANLAYLASCQPSTRNALGAATVNLARSSTR